MDFQSLLSGGGLNIPAPGQDVPTMDTSEQVLISPLALLKMLKHGRAGVPMEVMGLMLGDFVDDYTVRVVDVFAMPQSGTGVSVEAVDPVFQTKMLDMLKQTGRPEMVVGWYHSHPGFGPWLSSVDVNTQMSFEQLNKRAVAVVIDPIQSVKGKVVIDAFRCIPSQNIIAQREPRQTTSNIGHLHKPSIVALIHGLNRHYYSIAMSYRTNQPEQAALKLIERGVGLPAGRSDLNSLAPVPKEAWSKEVKAKTAEMVKLSEMYAKSIREELDMTPEQLEKRHVGKRDPKRHLKDQAEDLAALNILQSISTSLSTSCLS